MNPFKKEKLTCKNNLNEKGGKYFHVKLFSLKLYPFPLTHLCLVSHKRDISKQCRPRSNAAECGVWSGSTLFALSTGISIKYGNNKN